MRAFFRSICAALFVFSGGLIFGQTVNLSQLNPSQIDLSKVDLSDASLYFQGPAEFYVTGIGYGSETYSAILVYNGEGAFTVKAPEVVTTAGKPTAIDLSKASFGLTPNGRLAVEGVNIGSNYSGRVAFSEANRDFEFVSYGPEAQGESAGAQSGNVTVNLAQIDPAQINMSEVNLSNAAIYFQGPMKLYATGIRYGGQSYAAILDYNGNGRFTVEAPQTVTTAGKPTSINLAHVQLGLSSQGITVSGLDVDGISYTGTLVYSPSNRDIQIASYQPQAVVQPAAPPAVQATVQPAAQPTTSAAQVAELNQQVNSLKAQTSTLNQQINTLKNQLAAAQTTSTAPPYETAASRLATFVVSGFSSGSGVSGSWSQSGSTLQQTDAGQLFAKYAIPANQSGNELLYSFTANATGNGWRGFGLHFLASGSTAADGWGYGQSYLVWVTRDPVHLQTNATFVQLYKSSNDHHMVQIASKEIANSINNPMKVSVYVNKSDSSIDVMVNGNLAFSYVDPNFIPSGNTVALRALGTDTFSSLRVLAP